MKRRALGGGPQKQSVCWVCVIFEVLLNFSVHSQLAFIKMSLCGLISVKIEEIFMQ